MTIQEWELGIKAYCVFAGIAFLIYACLIFEQLYEWEDDYDIYLHGISGVNNDRNTYATVSGTMSNRI